MWGATSTTTIRFPGTNSRAPQLHTHTYIYRDAQWDQLKAPRHDTAFLGGEQHYRIQLGICIYRNHTYEAEELSSSIIICATVTEAAAAETENNKEAKK